MITTNHLERVKYLLAMVFFNLMFLAASAQDSTSSGGSVTVTKTTRTETQTWLSQPWLWVIGGAVFIILLIALLRSGNRSSGHTNKVTVTKTVSTDSD